MRYHDFMDNWHGFGTDLSISQVYETTIMDSGSGLSAHFVVIPARSLGGESYLFRETYGPLEQLGLQVLADIPGGGVVRSLAACLVSETADEFLQKFHEGFRKEIEHSDPTLPVPFAFAEYLTFARIIPFEWSEMAADSLGNILTAQGRGYSAYTRYEETETPMLAIAIRSGVLICGSTPKVEAALEAGLRQRIFELVKTHSKAQNEPL